MMSKLKLIPKAGWILMIVGAVAWVGDAIPVVNILTTVAYWTVWFFVMAVGFFDKLKNPKVLAVAGVSFLLGLIPFVSLIPWDIIGTFFTFIIGANKQ